MLVKLPSSVKRGLDSGNCPVLAALSGPREKLINFVHDFGREHDP